MKKISFIAIVLFPVLLLCSCITLTRSYDTASIVFPDYLSDAKCFPKQLNGIEKVNKFVSYNMSILLFDDRYVVLDCEYSDDAFINELERLNSLDEYVRFDNGNLFSHLTYLDYQAYFYYTNHNKDNIRFTGSYNDYASVDADNNRVVYVFSSNINSSQMEIDKSFLPISAPNENESFDIWFFEQRGEPMTLDYSSPEYRSGNYFYFVAEDNSAVVMGYEGKDSIIQIPGIIRGHRVSALGMWTFQDNNSVEKIRIPNSVILIDNCCFRYCRKLKEVYIPASVQSIARDAFYGCNNLERIRVDSKNAFYYDDGGSLYNKQTGELIFSVKAK